MKNTTLLTVWLMATSISFAYAEETNIVASPCNAEISIRLKEPAKQVATNQPVAVIIQVKNLSTNETVVFFGRNGNVPSDFTWTITSPSGGDVSPKPDISHEAISGSFARIKPLESEEAEYDLNSVCKFLQAGTYKVIARKQVILLTPSSERRTCEIRSAPLNIVISK